MFELEKFVAQEFFMETNCVSEYVNDTLSKEGDCVTCCERCMVLTP